MSMRLTSIFLWSIALTLFVNVIDHILITIFEKIMKIFCNQLFRILSTYWETKRELIKLMSSSGLRKENFYRWAYICINIRSFHHTYRCHDSLWIFLSAILQSCFIHSFLGKRSCHKRMHGWIVRAECILSILSIR